MTAVLFFLIFLVWYFKYWLFLPPFCSFTTDLHQSGRGESCKRAGDPHESNTVSHTDADDDPVDGGSGRGCPFATPALSQVLDDSDAVYVCQ